MAFLHKGLDHQSSADMLSLGHSLTLDVGSFRAKGSMSTFGLEPGMCGPASVLHAGPSLITLSDSHPQCWLRVAIILSPATCHMSDRRQEWSISLISSRVFGDRYSTMLMATDPCNTFPSSLTSVVTLHFPRLVFLWEWDQSSHWAHRTLSYHQHERDH